MAVNNKLSIKMLLILELSLLLVILSVNGKELDGDNNTGNRRSGLSPKLQQSQSTTAATIESLIEEVEEKEEEKKKLNNKKEVKINNQNDDENEDDNKSTTRDPKKSNFQEERFSNLFSSRTRSRGVRLPPVRYTQRIKPTLPSFIRNTPTPRPVTFQPTYVQRTGERTNRIVESNYQRSGRLTDSNNGNNRSGRLSTTTTTTARPTAATRRSSRQRDLNNNNPVIVPISDTRSRGRFSSITPRNSTRSSLTRTRNAIGGSATRA